MMDDIGVMAYYWKMLAGYVPWLLVGAGVGGGGMTGGVLELSKGYILLVAYDDDGCITKYETIRPFLVKTVNERAIQWAGKGEFPEKFIPMKIPEDKSVVYVFQPGGSWLDDQDVPDMRISGVF